MARRKRTSLRRWKARCRIGCLIPAIAIREHRLDRWFVFDTAVYSNHEFFRAFFAVGPRHG